VAADVDQPGTEPGRKQVRRFTLALAASSLVAVALLPLACAPPGGAGSPRAASPTAPAVAAARSETPTAVPDRATPRATPKATRQPSGSPSPAGTTSGGGTAAERYLRYATESNAARDDLDARYPRDFASLGEAALYYREYADIVRRFADKVTTIEFPPSVQPEAVELMGRLDEEIRAAMRASQAPTWDELWTAQNDLDRVSGFGTDAANRLRAALSLPSVPTETP
jgi:hypothetical protein